VGPDRSEEVGPAEPASLGRRVVVECLGTALLLAAVVGSGIMGERLAGGNVAVALMANSLATGAVLVALIVALGPISGAHLNPLVTIATTVRTAFPMREAWGYIAAQIAGAFTGVALAHGMFGEQAFSASQHVRAGASQALSEFVATFGLVGIVWTTSRSATLLAPLAIAGYITGAYWFTASTCFANPAVTLARAGTDTFAGIRPVDVPLFLVAQLAGTGVAVGVFRWITAQKRRQPVPNVDSVEESPT
jgi:glycerol uptake facilitator-like aquaporin